MAGTFERDHFSFAYPENWSVEEEAESEQCHEVSLTSPTGSIWNLHLFHDGRSIEEAADEILAELKREYGEIEAFPFQKKVEEREVSGYDLDFFYLDFIVTGNITAFKFQDQVACATSQAETREFETMEAVFQAITVSFMRSESNA